MGVILPTPDPWPTIIPVNPQLSPTPTSTPDKVVRVRHYSDAIQAIRNTMILKSQMRFTFNVWVEYPITTGYEEEEIRETVKSFFIYPIEGVGGFVEFNVDLNKWILKQDPNLPLVYNAKAISLIDMGAEYMLNGFPLNQLGVDPKFFDWRGNPLN